MAPGKVRGSLAIFLMKDPLFNPDFDYYSPANKDPRGSWRQRTFKLREQRGDRCEFVDPETKKRCRATSYLEFAHIKKTGLNGRGRGQTQRVRDIERYPDAYLLVCKSHHKLLGNPKY